MTDSHQLHIQVARSFEEVAALRSEWDAMASDLFTLRWNWLHNWWMAFSNGEQGQSSRQLILVILRDAQQRLAGFAPLYRHRSTVGRSLRFLGDGATSSDYVRILAAPDLASSVGERVAHWVASPDFRLEFGAVDWVEVEGHTDQDHSWVAFWNQLVRENWSRETHEIEGTWSTRLSPDWSAFVGRITKSRRRKVKKADRLLNDGTLTFRILTRPEEIESHWPTFVDLHQARRQQMGQPGCFANPRFEQFLKNATAASAADGQVWLACLETDRRPIGYLLLFLDQDRISMYQSGFDPGFEHLEPGHAINTAILRTAHEQSRVHFDFLRGDEAYKSAWATEKTCLFRTRCTAPNLSSQLKNTVWVAGRQLKHWTTALSPHPTN